MSDTKQILSSIANLPKGEMLYVYTNGCFATLALDTNQLHQLHDYVERVEPMLFLVRTEAGFCRRTEAIEICEGIRDNAMLRKDEHDALSLLIDAEKPQDAILFYPERKTQRVDSLERVLTFLEKRFGIGGANSFGPHIPRVMDAFAASETSELEAENESLRARLELLETELANCRSALNSF